MNFAYIFRQAILQHTSERSHLEDCLALHETAEPKQLYSYGFSKQDSDVILTPFNLHYASVSFNTLWKYTKDRSSLVLSGDKKQTSGIKWVKMQSKTDIHWSSKLKAHVILFNLETLFSLKLLSLCLTYTYSRFKISWLDFCLSHLGKDSLCIQESNPHLVQSVLNFNLR